MKTTKTKALAAALVMSMAVTGTVPETMQVTDPFAITAEGCHLTKCTISHILKTDNLSLTAWDE